MKKYAPIILMLAGYAAISLLVFWPIWDNFGTQILGNSSSLGNAQDGLQNIWNFWWAKKTCLGFCGNLWYTDFQFYPQGTSLLFHTFSLPNLAVAYPFLRAGLSYVASFNVSLLIVVFTSMVFAYILVNYLTKNRFAGAIAGLAYGLSPYMIGHLIDGQLNLTNIQYFPLLIYFLYKIDETKQKAYIVLTGIILLLIGLTDFIYLIFAFFVLALWLLARILKDRTGLRILFIQITVAIVIFAVPFLIIYQQNFREFNQFNLNGETIWNSEFSSAQLGGYLTPPPNTLIGHFFTAKNYPALYSHTTEYKDNFYKGIYSDKSIYLGVTLLALALLGIFSIRKKGFLWYLLLFIPIMLSFGPKMIVFGKEIPGVMPYTILSHLPILNILRAPSRFAVLALLSIIVLAGYGIKYIAKKIPQRYIYAFYLLILVLIMIDFFPIYSQKRDLTVPIAYKKIQELPGDFKILEIPTLWMSGLENKGDYSIDALYYQTFHEKRMASGYVTRIKNDDFSAYQKIFLLRSTINWKNRNSIDPETLKTIERYEDLTAETILKDNAYSYLIFHKEVDTFKKIEDAIAKNAPLFFEDSAYTIYKVK